MFFFQAEDGIRDYYASRGLGDVYKRQACKSIDFSLLNMQICDVLVGVVAGGCNLS